MGLIKAAAGAFGGTMADQWKEFFYCDAIDKDVLVVKGEKRVGGRSSNKKGSDNIISSGSGIAVADGQCMIIVEQGKVVEVCAEPGQFTYDASTEPSIFAGSLGEGIHRTFDTVKKRFTFGGDTGKDQRVYYFNTKELVDNKFGTANPIPFRVVDRNIGLDIDVSVRCNGVYSYKIVDPLLFYTNVCGNVEQQYDREEIEVQLKTEFVSALQPAFAKISELQIRPSAIPGHVLELCDAMNEALTKKWQQTRGLAVVSIAMNPVTLPEEDAQLIKDAQKNAILRDPTMAAATLAGAQADAMKSAASNTAGPDLWEWAWQARQVERICRISIRWGHSSRQHSSRLHRICSRHPGQEHGNVNVVQRIQENSALNVVNRNRSGKSGYAAAAQ